MRDDFTQRPPGDDDQEIIIDGYGNTVSGNRPMKMKPQVYG